MGGSSAADRVALRVELAPEPPVADRPVELVERKGIGHPDTICDAVAEAISRELVRLYRRATGRILHHNIDKVLLAAGEVELRFGGGRVIRPMRLVVGDRATFEWRGEPLPVAQAVRRAVRTWFRRHLAAVDPDRHLELQLELRPTSAELAGLFARPGPVLPANDTSVGVGFAPLTPLERLVLKTERFLQSAAFRRAFPATGEDVKVMGRRVEDRVEVTVACAFLARRIRSEGAYFRTRRAVEEALARGLASLCAPFREVRFRLNPLDRPGLGLAGTYLTLLGTSAEQGDSGEVGRGNRVNGLISFVRPASVEAAAGKNPVSHVGKIYNVFAHRLAVALHRALPIRAATVWCLSRIGTPVDRPPLVLVRLHPRGRSGGDLSRSAGRVVAAALREMPRLLDALAAGRLGLY